MTPLASNSSIGYLHMHTVVFLRLCLGVHVVAQVKHEVAGLKLVDAAREGADSL